MPYPAGRPATPVVQPKPLQKLRSNVPTESSGPESDSTSSTAERPCCRLPLVPDPSAPIETIPQLGLDKPATLEERFLNTMAIQPAVGSTVRAAAVIPQDRRAAGH